MPNKREIGNTIAALRSAHGLTQKELAAAAGITNTQISKYESAQQMPSPASLDALMAALHVNHTEFFALQRFLARIDHRRQRLAEGGSAPDEDAPYPEAGEGSGFGLAGSLSEGGEPLEDRQAQVERLAADAGDVIHRAVRLFFERSQAEKDDPPDSSHSDR